MFLGKHPRSVDVKGRLAIPVRFREQLPGGSVITISPDGALRVYPPVEWTAATESLKLNEATSPSERALIRRLFAEAQEVEFDRQGRVLVPASLREQAGITDSAVVSGANNVVEIWSEKRWQELEAATADFTRLADEVASARRTS
jgi:MraZ protein